MTKLEHKIRLLLNSFEKRTTGLLIKRLDLMLLYDYEKYDKKFDSK